jgi:hypothetical protein
MPRTLMGNTSASFDRERTQAPDQEPTKQAPDTLCLKWRETWPGEKHQDFSAFDRRMKGEFVGRIYELYHSPMQGKWFWGVTADGPDISRPAPASGYEKSARAAAAKVEAAWFAAISHLPDGAPDASFGYRWQEKMM